MLALLFRIAIVLPCVFLLPGFVLVRSRLNSNDRYSPLEKVYIVLSVSVSLTSLVALFLAEIGLFDVWLVSGLIALVSLLIFLLFNRRAGRKSYSKNNKGVRPVDVILFVALLIYAVVFLLKPAQYIAGDGDPGYYFNIGYSISRTGSVEIRDPAVPEMTEFEIKNFFKTGVVQFIPFHLRDRDRGKIQALLYDLIPVWIALFISIFGKHGGLYAVSVFGLLSSLGVFFIGRRLAGKFWGTVAAFLFVSFYPQVWFSRMPTSEIVCQFFILTGIFFLLLYGERETPLLAVAIPLSLLSAAFARPEATIALAILFISLVLRTPFKKDLGCDRILANASLGALAPVWLYIRFCEYHYVRANLKKIVDILGGQRGMDAFLTVYITSVFVGFILYNWMAYIQPRISSFVNSRGLTAATRDKLKGALRALLVFFIFAALIYFYFSAPERGRLPTSPQKFFFSSSVFLGGFSVILFIIGLCLLLFDIQDITLSFFITSMCLIYLVVFTESSITAGYLPWLARRYLPLLYPMLILGFCYMLSKMFTKGGFSLKAASLILACGLFAFFLFSTSPIFNHVEYKGFERKVEHISRMLKGDVVIFTSQFLGESVGIPLRYQYGLDARRVYDLSDARGFEKMVRQYSARKKKVLIEVSGLSSIGYSTSLFERLWFEKRFDFTVSFARLGKAYRVIPRNKGVEKHELVFFEVKPALSQ